MTMKRMLFFYQGRFSYTNTTVQAGLQAQFPGSEIRGININDLLKKRPLVLMANALAAGRQYGWDLVRRKRDLDDSFFGTSYIFEQVRRLALEVHRNWPVDCSFQTQSIFDCSAPGVPHYVYTDHTYESCKEYPIYGRALCTPVRPEWLIDLERGIYEHATCVFTMSHNVSQTLIAAYGLSADKVQCVRAGCNALHEQLKAIPLDLSRYQAKNILFIGKEWERKGGPELVAAFQRVRQVQAEATLTIAGCRPKLSEPGVRVVGLLPLDAVAALYASAAVFCMPSKTEPVGIVFLEAMAAGLPVIALRLGAAPDFVLDGLTGLTLKPDDIPALAEALVKLLSAPELCRKMGQEGRTLVSSNYTWAGTCAALAGRIRGDLGLGETLPGQARE